ncbi:MAG: tRNA lysidine(34) synthetase TilS, partial [Zetaproteobacteria bacterium]|nr:tRNA lysidine(34) synthetase TilS [Zetaproteobacteria bacterium]
MDLISTRIEANITINFPFLKDAKLLVAVSGGLDSMVAVNLLQKIGLHFGVAHCNFKLRGDESDIDAQFVKDWATKNECACFIAEFNTKNYAKLHKISIEMAARNLRYQWFHQLRVANGYDYIITAHHANDNLETTLYNFTRGTGFKGLLGIPPQNDKIIRPFLPLSREEIASYAKKNDIIWREDQSNATLEYTRNKIRHQVIPVLQKINPNLIESFQKTLSHLNDLE